MKKSKKEICSIHGCDIRCIGTKLLLLGVLIGLNSTYGWLTWSMFIGSILVLKGLFLILVPNCMCK